MTGTPEPYLSTREAAEELNVSLRTVQLWVEAGLLRAWKTEGGHRRIFRSSLDELLANRVRRIATTARGARPARVLLVEPEPDARRLLELHLRSWGPGLETQAVSNGFDALLRIGRQIPDLIITELKLPGMDGISMIRALRANLPTRDLGIIVVTSLARATLRERGGLPADITVLTRPLRFDDLRGLVLGRLGEDCTLTVAG
ncbi:MAG: excisionase family DNA-binding protein [Steroidobacteraceae bacterium]